MRRAIAATSPVARAPFGVLFRFQIPHFNLFSGFFGFFSLCHFHSPVSFVSFSNTEFVKIVLGRNSRLGYLLWCGGRSFLIKKFWKNRPRQGDGTEARVFKLRVATPAPYAGATAPPADGRGALGILFRFQIADLNLFFFGFFGCSGFFFLCHFVFPFCWFRSAALNAFQTLFWGRTAAATPARVWKALMF
jgi:hypothetical protein